MLYLLSLILVLCVAHSTQLNMYHYRFVIEINKARAQVGAGAVCLCPYMDNAARTHSQEMQVIQTLRHSQSVLSSVRAAHMNLPQPVATAENIAYNYQVLGKTVFDQWMNSPPHRVNMLHPTYNKIGLGMVKDSDGKVWWTLMMMQTPGLCYKFSQSNGKLQARLINS